MASRFIKRNKEGFIVGIVTSIVFLFIQPILETIGTFLVETLISISTDFADFYYLSVSKFSDYDIFGYFTSGLVLVIFTFHMNEKISKQFKLLYLDKAEHNLLKSSSENLLNKVYRPKMSNSSDFRNVKTLLKELEKKIKNRKSFMTYYITFYAASVLYFFLFLTFYFSIKDQNNKFDNNLRAIKPYVHDSIINRLDSKWVTMQNEQDYDTLYVEIDRYLSKYKLNLSKP